MHTNTTHTHKMEYQYALKNKEILSFVTTWKKLEGVMLSTKALGEGAGGGAKGEELLVW